MRDYRLTRLQTEVIKFIKDKQERESQKMQDLIRSYIRTYAPMFVGAVISFLATKGITLDTETQTALVVAFTGLLQALYYAIARLLERKYPIVGKILLGSSKQPSYEK